MKNKKNIGLKIGIIFSFVSFLLTFTIVGPMFSVMPAIFLENLVSNIFPNISYATMCKANLLVFIILFFTTLFLTMKNIKKRVILRKNTSTLRIVFTMFAFFLIVHPIGYYLFLWFSDFPSDALNAIMSVSSFPFTSLSFIIIGFLIDRQYEKNLNKLFIQN